MRYKETLSAKGQMVKSNRKEEQNWSSMGSLPLVQVREGKTRTMRVGKSVCHRGGLVKGKENGTLVEGSVQ